DVEQLVAQTGEDDATDVGSGCRGIKVVGIFGQSDPERRLSQCRGGGNHDAQDNAGKKPREPHRFYLLITTSSRRKHLIPQEARTMGWPEFLAWLSLPNCFCSGRSGRPPPSSAIGRVRGG